MKIDIEGGEYSVVPLMQGLLRRASVHCLISFHPRFAAPGKMRWPQTIRLTRRVFAAFPSYRVFRVRKGTIRRSRLVEWAMMVRAPMFEARGTYLLSRSTQALKPFG
jgi:hypothetical protein